MNKEKLERRLYLLEGIKRCEEKGIRPHDMPNDYSVNMEQLNVEIEKCKRGFDVK